ncbi:alpha/beta fold hydrolase [Gordonia sp. DT101]|uniref:alpha/beta fold hydrolase n=1 Tax=Gordonia sp. DT101 TaxID=3416545 RepID=UPI003CF73066
MSPRTLWWADGAQAAVESGEQVHVHAAGSDVIDAVRLAIAHPDAVISLVLAEPAGLDDAESALLTDVAVPTLVLASAPDLDTDLSAAQKIAGDVENGVFVIIDGSPQPVHLRSAESYGEWSASFMAIAEGLAARDGRLLTPPTPLLEGVHP